MFLEIDELKSAIYQYQADEISENDNDILLMDINAAISEVKGYLRTRYDVEKIFGETGNDRDPLILELTKNIAVWYVVRLSNVDMIYQHAKERYDAAIDWLKQVAGGSVAPDLPPLTNEDGDIATKFRFGSHPKFNHTYI